MLGGLIKAMIGPILGPLIDRIPDPNERARAREQAENQMLSAMTSLVEGQLKINEQEAKHTSIFVAGWRPAIGWICGTALGWNFIIYPIFQWLAFLYGMDLEGMPTLDAGELMTVLLGMLGLGGMRTYEKRMGVARSTMGKDLDKQSK